MGLAFVRDQLAQALNSVVRPPLWSDHLRTWATVTGSELHLRASSESRIKVTKQRRGLRTLPPAVNPCGHCGFIDGCVSAARLGLLRRESIRDRVDKYLSFGGFCTRWPLLVPKTRKRWLGAR